MPRFFVENLSGDVITLEGENAAHASRSLRMTTGESLILCDGCGNEADCVITGITGDTVLCTVQDTHPSKGEPTVSLTLYQAYPKQDKLEFIVQKAVELGASAVVPVLSERCIARPDSKNYAKKQIRLQKIAVEAAKQSGRGKIPTIENLLSFSKTLERIQKTEDIGLFCYEGGGERLSAALFSAICPSFPCEKIKIGLFIGSEGGFSPAEANDARRAGLTPVTLGPRILRCETAPVAAISICMYLTGNC